MAEIRKINIGKEFIVKFGVCETNVTDEKIAAICESLPIYIEEAIRGTIVENGEISVEPVRHGCWANEETAVTCTACGRSYDTDFEIKRNVILAFKRCPDCGAKMDGDNGFTEHCKRCVYQYRKTLNLQEAAKIADKPVAESGLAPATENFELMEG